MDSLSRTDLNNTTDTTPSLTQHIGAWLLIPSVWFKLVGRPSPWEFESTAQAGRMANAGPLRLQEAGSSDDHLTILGMGWSWQPISSCTKFALIGFETGGATGDRLKPRCVTTAPIAVQPHKMRAPISTTAGSRAQPSGQFDAQLLFSPTTTSTNFLPPNHGDRHQCHLLQTFHAIGWT